MRAVGVPPLRTTPLNPPILKNENGGRINPFPLKSRPLRFWGELEGGGCGETQAIFLVFPMKSSYNEYRYS